MSIDVSKEKLLTIPAAARSLPHGPAHVATVWRWIQTGCRGVRLESVLVGGKRFTSEEALQRFFERGNAAADGKPIPARSAKQRERAIEAAERELAAAGI